MKSDEDLPSEQNSNFSNRSDDEPNRIELIQTRWSLIRDAHLQGQGRTVQEARQVLVLRYTSAIRRYVGAVVRNDDLADELSQEIVVRLLRGDFSGADPARGRFRDLLIVSTRNMIRTHLNRIRRSSTVPLPESESDRNHPSANDAEWLSAWRRSVLDKTWDRLTAESSNQDGVTALRLRVSDPDGDSKDLADRLSEQLRRTVSADAFRQLLSRTRRRFSQHLLDEIRASLPVETPEAVEEELAALQLLEYVGDFLNTGGSGKHQP